MAGSCTKHGSSTHSGAAMYQIELSHPGLHKHRIIRGRDRYVVEQKAAAQQAAWAEQWERKQEIEARRQALSDGKQEAEDRTLEAADILRSLEGILSHTLKVNDAIVWDSLRNLKSFSEPTPKAPDRATFEPRFNFIERLFASLRTRKEEDAAQRYSEAWSAWKASQVDWERRKAQYEAQRIATNARVDDFERRYKTAEPSAIEEYIDLVLSRSEYPNFFPREAEVSYSAESKTVGIDYELPSFDDLPRLKEVRYVSSRGDFKETYLKEVEAQRLYDSALYQVCLRTIHEIFEADAIDAADSVGFNGWVESVNRGTGKLTRACILSIVVSRKAFEEVALANVDPKACFRSLRGVAASQLSGMVAVAPVMQMNRDDPRFIPSVETISKLTEGKNIAAIGWEEFEHLIREVFERELKATGGEVKVTRASRDEGVDAVAFDPDPIRGGKIIIQAKRYTNTVGVSAVRDLYGTVVNEGATKGILVTTSTFGPESHAFAQGKPIVLMDGSNLLHLLSRHGTVARIDLKEAKQLDVALRRSTLPS